VFPYWPQLMISASWVRCRLGWCRGPASEWATTAPAALLLALASTMVSSQSFLRSLHASSANDADVHNTPLPSMSAARCWPRLHTDAGFAPTVPRSFLMSQTANAIPVWHVQVKSSAGRPSSASSSCQSSTLSLLAPHLLVRCHTDAPPAGNDVPGSLSPVQPFAPQLGLFHDRYVMGATMCSTKNDLVLICRQRGSPRRRTHAHRRPLRM